MTLTGCRILLISQGVSAVPIGIPSLAVAVAAESENNATLATGSFTPAVDDFHVIINLSRDGSSTSHGTPSPTGFTYTGTPDLRKTVEQSGASYCRTTIHTARVATSASGTVGVTAGGALFQQVLIVLVVPNVTAFDTAASGIGTTGTTLNAAFDTTPSASALSIGALGHDTTSGTLALTSHTAVTSAGGTVSTFRWDVFYKLLLPTDPLVFTGIPTGEERAAAGITLI